MTVQACVVGYPVKHSRSPKLHGYWIETYGLDAVYRAEAVTPDNARAFLANLSDRGYAGANVTIPHKEIAFEVAEPDARARAIGAANTLWYDDGRLRATNTDVDGFVHALDAASPGWQAESALVVGAGGAARAVIHGLIDCGVRHIHVVNRTLARAEPLRQRFGNRVCPWGWEAMGRLLPRAQLLVNTTSLGMTGEPPLVIDVADLPDGALVADIVYVPLRTPLLAAAQNRGLKTANGLDMLLHQAVGGFERWFGVRPRVTDEVYEFIAADIATDQHKT